ncbi:MAG: nucleotidyltransferase family protein [Candidatus Acidiferrum sp.]
MPLSGLSDLPSFRREWAVLLECASPASDVRRLVELACSADWSRLLVLAEEHGVLAHLAGRLRELDENLVPAEIRRTLLERHRAQVFSTLRMTAELFRLLDLFAAKDIPALVVKGPVLAMQAYGDPAMRSYGDLDLLVRQRDIRRATESLQATGYQAAVPLRAIDAGKIPGQYLFSKRDAKLLVELHNDFTLRYFPRRLPIEDFFARQIRVRLDAYDAPALSVEDELVLICIHGAKHLWERLIWVADVAALVSRQTGIDWERVSASARAVRAEHLLNTGLRLAADVLRAHLPEDVSALVRQDGVAAKLVAGILRWLPAAGYAPPSLFQRAAFRLRMRGGLLAAPAYLLRLSLSPTEEDWQAGGEICHNRLLDVLHRPFRLARKYGRGGKD